ncbi:hypothetical protein BH10ACT11_BH10ACT11_00240 [soil metagenome]
MTYETEKPPYEPDFDPYTPPPGQHDVDYEADEGPSPDDDHTRAWLEKIDRKLGVRSYAGGMALVIALAGAIIAIVLALGARDESATKNQLQSFKTQLSQAADQANKETAQQVDDLSATVDEISGSIDELRGADSTNASDIDAVQGDLDDLKGQISDLQSSQADPNASGGVTPDSKGLGDDIGDAIGGN